MIDLSMSPTENKEAAARHNNGKLRWHNFPLFLIRPMIEVADYGADKYATFNFLKGAPISQYLDCIKRHLDKFEDTTLPDKDPESGINHLAHVAWNALVAVYMVQNRPDLDDRWRSPVEKLSDHVCCEQCLKDLEE